MRIVQFIDSLHAGGAERMAVNISNVLAEEGHDVMLIVSRSKGALFKKVNSSVNVKILEKNSFWHIRAFLEFTKIIKNFNPHIVHAHSTSVFWAVFSNLIIKKKWQTVFHDHNGMRANFSFFQNLPFILISIYIDKIIVVNSDLKNWSERYMHLKKQNICFINNFPYLEHFDKLRDNLSIKVISLANLRPVKDQLTLIKAFDILVHDFKQKNLKLILAGNVYYDDYQTEIEQAISTHGLIDNVEKRGLVNDVEGLMAEADIGVLSSVSEGLPVSLLEYGLAALPVVVTNVGQCAEVLGNGQFGKLIVPKDAIEMANAILQIIKYPQEAKEKGQKFKEHVNKNYASGVFLKSYFNLLKN